MFPCSFDEANQIYDKPESMSYDECEALSTFTGLSADGVPVIISCWKPTREELDEINKTGRIWCFHYGTILPPHALAGNNPFKQEE